MWQLDHKTLELIQKIESVAPLAGCHVALTGGVLYKQGPRKDLDLLFYRIRQVATIDYVRLFDELEKVGITRVKSFGWVTKAAYGDEGIDIFFPEDCDAPNDRASGY